MLPRPGLPSYGSKSVSISRRGTDRVKTYAPLLAAPDSPILVGKPEWLFYEPYCQLMRQTLLAWQMTKAREFDASEWVHVHVIPELNLALRNRAEACAPRLEGETVADVWRSVLRKPERYRVMTPTEIVGPDSPEAWQAWRKWLKNRYLT